MDQLNNMKFAILRNWPLIQVSLGIKCPCISDLYTIYSYCAKIVESNDMYKKTDVAQQSLSLYEDVALIPAFERW